MLATKDTRETWYVLLLAAIHHARPLNRYLTNIQYHTKRMQRVFVTKWTPDSKYLVSGSDDGNIRLWRANASRREGVKSSRQRQAEEYNMKLVGRFEHMSVFHHLLYGLRDFY